MKNIHKIYGFIGFLLAAGTAVKADIVFFDYSEAPETLAITANDGSSAHGNLFFSLDGISPTSGELEVSLSALADKRDRNHWATIELGSGFLPVAPNQNIDLNTVFSLQPVELIAVTGRNQSDLYSDYIALRFSNADNEVYFGWAEISAQVAVNANGKESTASFSVERFAFNDTAGESILAGQTDSPVIPEPATASLVVGAGIGLLATRRLFLK